MSAAADTVALRHLVVNALQAESVRRGGFDEALNRLVDWDLILRLTATDGPVAVSVLTAHHVVDDLRLGNISTSVSAEHNLARIRAKLEGRA